MKDKNVYSVSQVNSYVKRLLDDDFILRNLFIRGEISNCKYHSSGHVYFSLKDESCVISAVMWRSDVRGLKFRLENGMQVIVRGRLSVYPQSGQYQVYVSSVEDAGKGDLAVRFEQLKKQLEEMGMFAEEYKKEIPRFAWRIGVVTAETGAVIRDIYHVASRRNPWCRLFLYPSLVQGEGAAESIAAGIACLDRMGLDVIIIGRGGGSMEDLWAFNEEAVARAIFQCETPVISAVGHETDFTIADFVADLRAPTPSAAAELAVFDYAQFEETLADYRYTLLQRITQHAERNRMRAKECALKLETLSPQHRLDEKKHMLVEKAGRMEELMDRILNSRKERAAVLFERLEGLSPLKRLNAGYSFAQDAKGNALLSIQQVEKGDLLSLHVTDGILKAEVLDKTEVLYGKGIE